jgi:predicted flap endonuclease-1-like 5' DNA nuclease
MFNLACWLWWFLAGALAGWLLSWLLDHLCGGSCKKTNGTCNNTSHHHGTPPSSSSFVAGSSTANNHVAKTIDINQWIGQAKSAGITVKGMNDLEIIDGIGPKIRALLNEHGIVSFAELSQASKERLQGILDKGGENFRLADPSTWAEQAKLCAEGRWAEFVKLTSELVGGKRPNKF